MSFIVEMWWGRPSETIIQGDSWKVAQELGKAFGWEPRGPLLHHWRREHPPTRVDSYAPDGWMEGLHEVEAHDARAWGAALEACAREVEAGRFELPAMRSVVLLRAGMTVDEYRQANRGLTVQFLRSFAAFLQKGRVRVRVGQLSEQI